MMYKRYFLLVLFLGLGFLAIGQTEILEEINQNRIRINKTNMYVLGGWAIGNIAVSGYLRSQTSGSVRSFHEMNVIWNFVNLGLAAGGLYGSFTEDPSGYDIWQTYQAQQNIEKILLFNMALNGTYMMTGAYLIERSRRATDLSDRFKGWGQSLILQGGFLFVFDATQYMVHHFTNKPLLKDVLESVSVSPAGIGMVIPF